MNYAVHWELKRLINDNWVNNIYRNNNIESWRYEEILYVERKLYIRWSGWTFPLILDRMQYALNVYKKYVALDEKQNKNI